MPTRLCAEQWPKHTDPHVHDTVRAPRKATLQLAEQAVNLCTWRIIVFSKVEPACCKACESKVFLAQVVHPQDP